MAEETATGGGLYYCHMCSSAVSAVAAAEGEEEIKCPYCHSGFVEEIESARRSATAVAIADDRTGGEDGTDSGAGSAISVWAPIIDGMVGGAVDAGMDLFDFSERRRRTAGLLLLLQEMREHRLESFAAAAAVAGSGSSNVEAAVAPAPADSFRRRPALDALVQRLDAGRQATLPAKKEAVEAMPTVEAAAAADSACAVCLEDYAAGGELAREMPCRHRFHASCIVRWLESHSSCPVCRFQLPTDDDGDGGVAVAVSLADFYSSRMPLSAELRELRSFLSSRSSSTSGSSSQHREGD